MSELGYSVSSVVSDSASSRVYVSGSSELRYLRAIVLTEFGTSYLRSPRLECRMRIVALVGQKGGVGKTTTTMNLAAVTAKHSRVLVVDVDPQRSTTWWAENAGERLPFDFTADVDPGNLSRMRELPYDVIFVDTPGSLDNTTVLSTVLDAADFVILPLNPEPLNTPALARTIRQHIEPRGLDYRVLLNKIDRRRSGQLEDWEQLVDGGLRIPRFSQHVRLAASIADAPLDGKVVTEYSDTRQNANAIFDYTAVAFELAAIWANDTVTVGSN